MSALVSRRATGLRGGQGAPAGTPNYSPSSFLTTPTYTGVGQCLEPDVLFFPAGWNSWEYWMAMVPLANGDPDARFENPSILVSHNGLDWSVPAGLTNPIQPQGTNQFNADSMLCMSADGLTMYCFWVITDTVTAANRGVWVRSSTNGTTWSAASQVLTDTTGNVVEPKVVYDPKAALFRLYTYNVANNGLLQVRTSATPTSGYSAPTTCSLTVPGTRGGGGANFLWHYSILREPTGRYILSFCDQSNANSQGGAGWLASSWDGVTWTCATRSFLGSAPWMSAGPYRPCIQQISTGLYGVWVSCQGTANHVGFTAVPASEIP